MRPPAVRPIRARSPTIVDAGCAALAKGVGTGLFGEVERATLSSPESRPVRRREIFGWCCYDFANSAFTTIIITVVFAPWFMGVIAAGDARGPGWWGTALAVSQIVVLMFSPLIGAIADVKAQKKFYLMTMAAVCSAATL